LNQKIKDKCFDKTGFISLKDLSVKDLSGAASNSGDDGNYLKIKSNQKQKEGTQMAKNKNRKR